MARHPRSSTQLTQGRTRSGNSMTLAIENIPCENVTIDLEDVDLWTTFTTGVTNEMIITKSGRKLFPVVRLRVRGLKERGMYSVSMDFQQKGDSRFKYTEGGWTNAGKAEPQPRDVSYVHEKSPNYGDYWMKKGVDFSKIKVTNKESQDMIRLNSLHLYEPIIRIMKVDPMAATGEVLVAEKLLPMCEFMAVTSYQNEEVTELKIKHNPFAKGFQDNRNFNKAMGLELIAIPSPNHTMPYSPLPVGSPDSAPGWNVSPGNGDQSPMLQLVPAPTPLSSQASHRFNPYGRHTTKAEKGYPPHLSKSHDVSPGNQQYQRRSTNSTYQNAAMYSLRPVNGEPGCPLPIDLTTPLMGHHAPACGNDAGQYLNTMSHQQFSYTPGYEGAPTIYNPNCFYNYPYGNSYYYGSHSGPEIGSPGNMGNSSSSPHGSNDSRSTSSGGSPVDVSVVDSSLPVGNQNVMY